MARRVADSVNYDLILARTIENQVRIRIGDRAPKADFAGVLAGMGMLQ
jgi:hypothetical protein